MLLVPKMREGETTVDDIRKIVNGGYASGDELVLPEEKEVEKPRARVIKDSFFTPADPI